MAPRGAAAIAEVAAFAHQRGAIPLAAAGLLVADRRPMEAIRTEHLQQDIAKSETVLVDVSKVQAHLRAAEQVRAELTRQFGAALATELIDRALAHEAVRSSAMPLTDLRAIVAGELLDRVGAVLVATGPLAFDERSALDAHADRLTAPETPVAIDRSEVRRALA